jgi:hypothetical protein
MLMIILKLGMESRALGNSPNMENFIVSGISSFTVASIMCYHRRSEDIGEL